jgi:hypothetical protein
MKRYTGISVIAAFTVPFLIAVTSCGGGGGPSLPEVAVLSNEAATLYTADVVEKLDATGQFSRVETINAATSTPSLSQLKPFDGVLVYTGDNGPALADTTALGDVLAAYVDDGGGLVVAFGAVVYYPVLPQYALGGRYVSDQYYLIPRVTRAFGSQSAGAVLDSTHPIMAGYTSFYGGSQSAWADTSQVFSGSVLLEWADGTPLVVAGDVGGVRRVDLNFYPPSSDSPDNRQWDPATDGGLLMAHSLKWVTELP